MSQKLIERPSKNRKKKIQNLKAGDQEVDHGGVGILGDDPLFNSTPPNHTDFLHRPGEKKHLSSIKIGCCRQISTGVSIISNYRGQKKSNHFHLAKSARKRCLKQWHRCNAKGRPDSILAIGGDVWNLPFQPLPDPASWFVLPQLAMLSMLLTALASKIHSWSPPAQRCNVSSQVNLGEINSTKRWRKKHPKICTSQEINGESMKIWRYHLKL